MIPIFSWNDQATLQPFPNFSPLATPTSSRSATITAGGLCLPHFVQITHHANAAQRATLLTIQQQVWDELAQNLEEFISQQMAHHHGDPISEPGRLALERTIAALTGEYPVH